MPLSLWKGRKDAASPTTVRRPKRKLQGLGLVRGSK